MSKNYNSTLQTNNSSLEDIITQLNNLPNAPASVGQATPTITVNSSTGLITATATQTAGYVAAGTKSATKQLAFQAAQTITPGTTNKTIPANTYLGGVQTIKGDANLVASNIVSGKSIFGVVGTATAGGGGGDTSVEDSLITKTITSYTNDRIIRIGGYAFAACTNLQTVNFPNCSTIARMAFIECSKLTTTNFPMVNIIDTGAFSMCSGLKSINFPQCTFIGINTFYGCYSLTTISFPLCTSIGSSAFYNCYSITTANFPKCTTINTGAFSNCRGLTTISFPLCTSIGSNAFFSCTSLTTVNFPECTLVSNYAFYRCTNLTMVSLPKCVKISGSAFYECSKLTSIYLAGSSLCQIEASTVFSKTSIWSNKGSIFVPASLLTSYKAASHWSYFSNRIFSYAF